MDKDENKGLETFLQELILMKEALCLEKTAIAMHVGFDLAQTVQCPRREMIEGLSDEAIEVYTQAFQARSPDRRIPFSFHNENHVRAVMLASKLLVQAALNDSSRDPIIIIQSLTNWNQKHPEGQITKKELSIIIQLAFAFHDLGNIARMEDGQLIYLPTYCARGLKEGDSKEAEERSCEIAQYLLGRSSLLEDQKKRFLPLIKHLIMQTKFVYDQDQEEKGYEKPFAVFARFCDQICNAVVSTDWNHPLGLAFENWQVDPEVEVNLFYYFNFVLLRAESLLRVLFLNSPNGEKVPEDEDKAIQGLLDRIELSKIKPMIKIFLSRDLLLGENDAPLPLREARIFLQVLEILNQVLRPKGFVSSYVPIIGNVKYSEFKIDLSKNPKVKIADLITRLNEVLYLPNSTSRVQGG